MPFARCDSFQAVSAGPLIHVLRDRGQGEPKPPVSTVRHSGTVRSIVFSPDGSRLISSEEKVLHIWDLTTTMSQPIVTIREKVSSPVVFPDGRMLAYGSGTEIKIVDLSTGKCIASLKGHNDAVQGLSCSSDGVTLASCGKDNLVKLWSVATGAMNCTTTLPAAAEEVSTVAFCPQGRKLAFASGKSVKLYDMRTRELLTLEGHRDEVLCLSFSPDGATLASSGLDTFVKIWRLSSPANQACLATLEREHKHPVVAVSFSPDGKRLASGSWDRTVKIWESGSGSWTNTAPPLRAQQSVCCLAFSPDGSAIAYGGMDNLVTIAPLSDGGAPTAILRDHSASISSLTMLKTQQGATSTFTLISIDQTLNGRVWMCRDPDSTAQWVPQGTFQAPKNPKQTKITDDWKSILLTFDDGSHEKVPLILVEGASSLNASITASEKSGVGGRESSFLLQLQLQNRIAELEGTLATIRRQSAPNRMAMFYCPRKNAFFDAPTALAALQTELGISQQDWLFPLDNIYTAVAKLSNTIAILNSVAEAIALDTAPPIDQNAPKVALPEETLHQRDRLRHEAVEQWKLVTGLESRMVTALRQLQDAELRTEASKGLEDARNTLNALRPVMEQHCKVNAAFGTRVAEENAPWPFQIAAERVRAFGKLIIPVKEARAAWRYATEKVEAKAQFAHIEPVPLDLQQEETIASRRCVDASETLRKAYDEVIPLLRFGFPELRTQIWDQVDKHCGLGTLRMDVSSQDFELSPLDGTPKQNSMVLKAKTKKPSQEVKRLRQEYFFKKFTSANDFYREMEALRIATSDGAHHLNVAEVEFAFEEGQGQHGAIFFMALPFYPIGSAQWFEARLVEFSRERSLRKTVGYTLLRALQEMVSGLSCLHFHQVIHGDLKPDNIMMDGTGSGAHPKLIDFNFSTVIAGMTNAMRIATAPLGYSADYSPPEFKACLSGSSAERTFASDVYSLGKTFCSLLHLERQMPHSTNSENLFGTPLFTSLKELVALMTKEAPEDRLSLSQRTEVCGPSARERLEQLMRDFDASVK